MYFLLNRISLTNKIPKVHLNNTSEKKGKNGLFTATTLKSPPKYGEKHLEKEDL